MPKLIVAVCAVCVFFAGYEVGKETQFWHDVTVLTEQKKAISEQLQDKKHDRTVMRHNRLLGSFPTPTPTPTATAATLYQL